MKVFLMPRARGRYGQDLLARRIGRQLRIKAVTTRNGAYTAIPADAQLAISHNLDVACDAQIISEISDRVPVIAHVHCQLGYYSSDQQARIGDALRHVKVAIVPAQFLTTTYSKAFPRLQWRTVYNGADAKKFTLASAENRLRFRRRYDVAADHVLVGIVGRLENAKGLQIIESITKMLSATRVTLLLQYPSNAKGEADSVALRLQRQNPNRIRLLPDNGCRQLKAIPFLDVLLTPSLSEACPMVVVEALTAGVPVVGTNSTCFYDELAHLGMPADAYRFFDLPAGCATEQPRQQLGLPSRVAEQLGISLLGHLDHRRPHTAAERRRIAESVRKSALSERVMLDSLAATYRAVELPGRSQVAKSGTSQVTKESQLLV